MKHIDSSCKKTETRNICDNRSEAESYRNKQKAHKIKQLQHILSTGNYYAALVTFTRVNLTFELPPHHLQTTIQLVLVTLANDIYLTVDTWALAMQAHAPIDMHKNGVFLQDLRCIPV